MDRPGWGQPAGPCPKAVTRVALLLHTYSERGRGSIDGMIRYYVCLAPLGYRRNVHVVNILSALTLTIRTQSLVPAS